MITLRSQIINKPVWLVDSESYIGKVADIVFTKDLLLAGLILDSFLPIFIPPKAILANDIISFDRDNIFINDESQVAKINDLPALTSLISQQLLGTGQLVITESGQKVGSIYDFAVDTETSAIKSLYLRSLWNERIIPADLIVEIHKKVFKIENELSDIKVEDLSPEPSNQ